ncbi:hypothetical protein [Paenibacillus tyrfis]|uniref:hypothetical protein n=1 Tax=Paenibacillus tyrfis TaxID=1501230 RepID=UPI00209F8515|nr:hypothetical protein [Paenibacillus tyrfis]MCP1310471.1 hypothetical protein [Paenibacillus tyrfis]
MKKFVALLAALTVLVSVAPVSAESLKVSSTKKEVNSLSSTYNVRPGDYQSFNPLYPVGNFPIEYEIKQSSSSFVNAKYQIFHYQDGDWRLVEEYYRAGNSTVRGMIYTNGGVGVYKLVVTNLTNYPSPADLRLEVQFYNAEGA